MVYGGHICRDLTRRLFFHFNIEVHVSSKLTETFESGAQLLNSRVVAGDLSLQKFSDNLSFSFSENVRSHELTIIGKP